MQNAVAPDPDARALSNRLVLQYAVLEHDAARVAVMRVEEVSVHAGDGCNRADALLHAGHALAPHDCVVREHRDERIEPAGLRRVDDMEDDRAVWCELDLPRVGDSRHQQRAVASLRMGGGGRDQDEHERDEQSTAHDRGPE